ncbi:MAG TPA: hypothetical protein VGJ33_16795 [Candidatus Angelobacter sp.]
MARFFRRARQRQQHIGYFAICFILFAFAAAFVRKIGWLAALGLWLACVVILELIYRWVLALGIRNRKKWWAQPRSYRYWRFYRLVLYGTAAAIGSMIRSPVLGYILLALLAAGLLCAGIIRWLTVRESQS